MKLVTYEWDFKKFTSQDRLHTLYLNGKISMEQTPFKRDGVEYGAHYSFFTKSGEPIAHFYKDHTFGFGTQATGVELKNVTSI